MNAAGVVGHMTTALDTADLNRLVQEVPAVGEPLADMHNCVMLDCAAPASGTTAGGNGPDRFGVFPPGADSAKACVFFENEPLTFLNDPSYVGEEVIGTAARDRTPSLGYSSKVKYDVKLSRDYGGYSFTSLEIEGIVEALQTARGGVSLSWLSADERKRLLKGVFQLVHDYYAPDKVAGFNIGELKQAAAQIKKLVGTSLARLNADDEITIIGQVVKLIRAGGFQNDGSSQNETAILWLEANPDAVYGLPPKEASVYDPNSSGSIAAKIAMQAGDLTVTKLASAYWYDVGMSVIIGQRTVPAPGNGDVTKRSPLAPDPRGVGEIRSGKVDPATQGINDRQNGLEVEANARAAAARKAANVAEEMLNTDTHVVMRRWNEGGQAYFQFYRHDTQQNGWVPVPYTTSSGPIPNGTGGVIPIKYLSASSILREWLGFDRRFRIVTQRA